MSSIFVVAALEDRDSILEEAIVVVASLLFCTELSVNSATVCVYIYIYVCVYCYCFIFATVLRW